MVKKYITWVAPDSQEAYTHTEVWKSTDQGVTWTEFDVVNDPNYGKDGIVIATSYAVDKVGDSGHWYKIRFYDNVGLVWSDYSDYMRGSDFRGYCTIADVRNYTNVQSGEYSDAAVQMLIDTCTSSIDSITNRTWQGSAVKTDAYLDGNGLEYMVIPDTDVSSVSSLALDDDDDGVFTTITPSLYYFYDDRGGILLDSLAEVTIFPKGRRKVKITYTHGNADPTDTVRHLCILMVANMMKMDATRTNMIEDLKGTLRVGNYTTI